MIIGYLNNLGNKELSRAAAIYRQKSTDQNLETKALSYSDIIDQLQDGKIDLALVNDRQDNLNTLNTLNTYQIADASVIAIIQKGTFDKHAQIVELADLRANSCIITCSIQEEKAEYYYYRDVLKIPNQLIADDSLNETILMTQAGSGFFLMNEYTAPLIKNNDLQKLFLFNQGKQLKEKYLLLSKARNSNTDSFAQILKQQFK